MTKRLMEHVSKGHEPYEGYATTTIGMAKELHAIIREQATKEERSFSNMCVILMKRGLKIEPTDL